MKALLMLAVLIVAHHVNATELSLWHQKEEARDWLPRIAKQYEADTGIKVRVSFLPTSELKANLVRAALQGNAPDLALVPSDFIGDYNRLNLSTVPKSYFSTSVDRAIMPLVTHNDQTYGVPLLGGNHLMMYYNKRYVTTPAKTWQQLVEQIPALREQGVEPIGWKYNEMYWFAAFLTAFDGFPVIGNDITLNTPEVQQALNFYKQIADSGMIHSRCDYDCGFNDFKDGKFAYAINGDWVFKDLSEALGQDFGVTLLPSIKGKPMRPLFSGIALIFPNQDLSVVPNKPLLDFVLYMQSESVQRQLYEDIGLLPAHSQVLHQIHQSANANVQAMLEQLKTAKAAPPLPALAASWIGMRRGFDLFTKGHSTTAQATALMQRVAEHELSKATNGKIKR